MQNAADSSPRKTLRQQNKITSIEKIQQRSSGRRTGLNTEQECTILFYMASCQVRL